MNDCLAIKTAPRQACEGMSPRQIRLGETIDVIEKQQNDLEGMTDEIRVRLFESQNLESGNKCVASTPDGYLNRLDVITERNNEILSTLTKILEAL